MYHILLLFYRDKAVPTLYRVYNIIHCIHVTTVKSRRPEECGLAVSVIQPPAIGSCVRVRNIIIPTPHYEI